MGCLMISPRATRAEAPVIDIALIATVLDLISIVRSDFSAIHAHGKVTIPLLRELRKLTMPSDQAISYAEPEDSQIRLEELFPGYVIREGLWEEHLEEVVNTSNETDKGALRAIFRHGSDIEEDVKNAASILEQSHAADGNLSATQAGNALTAAAVRQLAKLRQLFLAFMQSDITDRLVERNRRAQAEAKQRHWAWTPGRATEIGQPDDYRAFTGFGCINPKTVAECRRAREYAEPGVWDG